MDYYQIKTAKECGESGTILCRFGKRIGGGEGTSPI